jgi:hypothetical protein
MQAFFSIMIIFLKIFFYVTLFFFSFLFPERYAYADGKVFLETDEDAWIVGKELAQRAVISHKDGIQKLDIAIDVEAKGLSGLWLFPVPAKGKDISLDVKDDFKIPKGSLYSKVKQDTVESVFSSSLIYFSGFLFGGSGRIFILRSLVSTFFGSDDAFDGSIESTLSYYQSFSKLGLESEVVQANSLDDLFYYFSSREIIISDTDREIWKGYHLDGYSFIVSRFNSAGSNDIPKTLSLRLEFPSERAFFPLMPSRTYDDEVIPLQVFIKDYNKVHVPESLSPILKTDYLLNEKNNKITYTKASLNAPAKLFLDDMWFDKTSVSKSSKFFIENTHAFNYPNEGFITVSIIVILLSLFLFYKIFRVFGFLPMLVVVIGGIATLYLFRKNRSKNKIISGFSTFFLTPMVFVTAFGDWFFLLFISIFVVDKNKGGFSIFSSTFFYLEGAFGSIVVLIGLLTYCIIILRLLLVLVISNLANHRENLVSQDIAA